MQLYLSKYIYYPTLVLKTLFSFDFIVLIKNIIKNKKHHNITFVPSPAAIRESAWAGDNTTSSFIPSTKVPYNQQTNNNNNSS